MPVNIDSTTDSAEAVTAALGKVAEVKIEPVETPAAVEAKPLPTEIKEASETSTEKKSDTEAKEETAEQKAEREKQEKKAKKKGGIKRRIDKLNTRLSAAEQQAEFWRQKAFEAQKPAGKQSTDAKKPPETLVDGRPKEDAFETHAEYVEALADWKVEQKLSARDQKARESAVKSDFERKAKTHDEKVEKFKADHEDFDDVIESVDDVPMTTTVQQAILESEDGPALMYALAKNREVYEKICKLPALQAAREIGRLEARIAKTSEASIEKEVKTSKAPKPITPVDKSGVVVAKDYDDMNYQEFKKAREAELAKR